MVFGNSQRVILLSGDVKGWYAVDQRSPSQPARSQVACKDASTNRSVDEYYTDCGVCVYQLRGWCRKSGPCDI